MYETGNLFLEKLGKEIKSSHQMRISKLKAYLDKFGLSDVWLNIRNSGLITKEMCVCVCSNANPLHYYVLRVPRKADRWR